MWPWLPALGRAQTRTLVARYLGLLADGVPLRRIVAITFTIKAAREMRNRVRAQISEYLVGLRDPAERAFWQERLAQMDGARISTIHSLCTDILRSHPVEAEADPSFDVLADGAQSLLRLQVAEETLAWAVDQEQIAPLFRPLSTDNLESLIIEALAKRLELEDTLSQERDWPQVWRQARLDRLRAEVAYPGVAEAMAQLQALEQNGDLDYAEAKGCKLATHIREALNTWCSLEQVMAAADVQAAIDHLLSLKPCFDLRVGSARHWQGEFPRPIVKKLNEWHKELVKFLGKDKVDLSLDDALEALWPPLAVCLREALRRYRLAKDQRNALDFDDLEGRALQLLRECPTIRQEWREQIDALLVDEYQDTNRRQNELVMLLNGGEGDGQRTDNKLFIVGDGKQSIYGFRNADVSVFMAQQRAIRDCGGDLVCLSSSYRAHRALLGGLNELMARGVAVQGE